MKAPAPFDQDRIPSDEELFGPIDPNYDTYFKRPEPAAWDVVRLDDYRDPPPTSPAYDPIDTVLWWAVVALGTLCFAGAIVMIATTILR